MFVKPQRTHQLNFDIKPRNPEAEVQVRNPHFSKGGITCINCPDNDSCVHAWDVDNIMGHCVHNS